MKTTKTKSFSFNEVIAVVVVCCNLASCAGCASGTSELDREIAMETQAASKIRKKESDVSRKSLKLMPIETGFGQDTILVYDYHTLNDCMIINENALFQRKKITYKVLFYQHENGRTYCYYSDNGDFKSSNSRIPISQFKPIEGTMKFNFGDGSSLYLPLKGHQLYKLDDGVWISIPQETSLDKFGDWF